MRIRERRIPKTKIEKDVNRQTVQVRTAELTRLRTLGMSPFPFEPKQIYEAVMGPARMQAIQALPPNLFYRGAFFRFKVWQPERSLNAKLQVFMSEKVPLLSDGDFMDTECLSEHDRDKIITWAAARREAAADETKVDAAIKALLNTANTYGQIKGFWPTFGIFLPREVRDEFDSKRASRPSEDMLHAWSAATTLTPKDVDRILSEALMFDGMTFGERVTLFDS